MHLRQPSPNKTPIKYGGIISGAFFLFAVKWLLKVLDLFLSPGTFLPDASENIFELFPKKNDAQIADAILELFRKREDLEVFNKKALYIYIREMVDVKTPKITKIADKLYSIFKEQYIFYLENGYARF